MRELPEVGNRFGAAMGRSNNSHNREFPVVFEVERLEWVDGDYDQGGAYWGRTFENHVTQKGGDYIFRFEGESDLGIESMFVRARSMKSAKDEVVATYPKATFAASADLEAVYSGYKDAALWPSSNDRYDEDPDNEAEMLDATDYDLSEEAERHFRSVCAAFIEANADLIAEASEKGMDAEHVGHNLWLSQNGHGTGFWDRGLGELGDRLDEAAKQIGEDYLYVGDDDKIHSGNQYCSSPAQDVEAATP